MPTDLLAPWLLTYLLHSTLLLMAAWLIVRLWRGMPLSAQECLWRTALLGGALTASAQVAIGWEPWSGHLTVPQIDAAAPATAAAPPGEEPLRPSTAAAAVAAAESAPADESRSVVVPVAPTRAKPSAAGTQVDLGSVAGLVWLAGLALLLLRSHRTRAQLRRRLAGRAPLASGPLHARFEALLADIGRHGRIALLETPGMGSPVAFGVLRPQIVVPARTRELPAPQQEALLAHELAHHVRRDPLWLALTRSVTTVLFFQPLNLLAAKRLRETSELLCDAWAAQHTGRGRELAECLTAVAGWLVGERAPLAVPAMAAHGSMLERRVGRLLEGTAHRSTRVHRSSARLLAAVPLLAVALLAPSVANVAASTPAPTPSSPILAPAESTAQALALLDEEIARLETECTTLLDLLGQVRDAPEALRQGAARLAGHLTTLKTRRAALARGAQESTR